VSRVSPHWNRLVILGASLLCVFGLVAGHRCRQAEAPSPGPRAAADRVDDPSFLGHVRVRVTDMQGHPLTGARLTMTLLVTRTVAGPSVIAQTDGQGQARLSVGLSGRYWLLVSAPGRARIFRRISVDRPGEQDLGTVRLPPGQTASGRVVDPSGAPVPGATVSVVSALDLPQRPLEPPHWAVADAQGRFRIPGLLARAYRLTVRADGFGLSVLRAVSAPAVGLRIRLRPLRHIIGRVLVGDAPAPGAVVELAGSGVWPPIRTTADALGRFRFLDLREGIYELRASRGLWVSRPAEAVDLLGSGPPPEVELHLLEGTTVTGRVVDADSKKPLGRVRVTAAQDYLAVNPRIAQTTADGSFVLTPVLPGEYRITLERDGYLPRLAIAHTVLPGENPPLQLALHRGGVLEGVVIDDTGRQVVGASIEVIGRARGSYIADRSGETVSTQRQLWDQALRSLAGGVAVADATATPPGSLGVLPGPLPVLPVLDRPGAPRLTFSGRAALLTDDKGRFRIAGVPPGNLSLVVRHSAYSRGRAGPFRLGRGEARKGLVIRLRPGTKLRGTVLGQVKEPLAGVEVSVADPSDPFHHAVRFTDSSGRFEIPNLKGRIRLSLSAPGFVPLVHHLRVSAGASAQRIVLTLQPASCRLEGRLRDRHRMPVEGARISLVSVTPDAPSRAVAVSDPDGKLVVGGLGRITYRATVHHERYPDHHFEVSCPSKPVQWRLRYGGGVAFEVRDRQTRALIPSFRYVLRRAGGPVIRRDGSAGRAQERLIPGGRYELTVRAPSYAQVRQTVQVPNGRLPRQVTRRGLVLWLELAGSVSGHVRDDRGLAVQDAVVAVSGLEARSDRQGRFTIHDVPPGTHELTATHPDRGTGRLGGVVVRRGLPTVNLVIDLTPGAAAPKAVQAGVRLTLVERLDKLRVQSVAVGSAAERAGVAGGDELVSVDGQDLDGLGLSDVAALLRGPAGTSVVLELRRSGRTVKLSLKREILDP